MNLWLKSLKRYSVPQINTYPTVTNAVTIITTLSYGWTSDALQLRSPIVYFSLVVCFFAAMNLAIWDGVPFGLKWASYYLTGFAQGSGPIFLTMVNEVRLPTFNPLFSIPHPKFHSQIPRPCHRHTYFQTPQKLTTHTLLGMLLRLPRAKVHPRNHKLSSLRLQRLDPPAHLQHHKGPPVPTG